MRKVYCDVHPVFQCFGCLEESLFSYIKRIVGSYFNGCFGLSMIKFNRKWETHKFEMTIHPKSKIHIFPLPVLFVNFDCFGVSCSGLGISAVEVSTFSSIKQDGTSLFLTNLLSQLTLKLSQEGCYQCLYPFHEHKPLIHRCMFLLWKENKRRTTF